MVIGGWRFVFGRLVVGGLLVMGGLRGGVLVMGGLVTGGSCRRLLVVGWLFLLLRG